MDPCFLKKEIPYSLIIMKKSLIIITDVKEISGANIVSDIRNGRLTKALRLNSPKNSVDSIHFLLKESDESSDTVVFDTEIKLCDADGDNSFAIYHKTADGKIANKLIFGYSASTGSIFAQNEFVKSGGNGRDFSQVLLYEGVGDYFNLRIEYSKVSETSVKTKIYINGTELTLAESTTPYSGAAIDAREVTEVVFETYSTKKLSLCFDNVLINYADLVKDPPSDTPVLPPLGVGDGSGMFDDETDGSVNNNGWT